MSTADPLDVSDIPTPEQHRRGRSPEADRAAAAAILDAVRDALRESKPGETFVVVDVQPSRDAEDTVNAALATRGWRLEYAAFGGAWALREVDTGAP